MMCQHCRGTGSQRALYAPGPYPCEDCKGVGRLGECADCGGEYPLTLGRDEGCPECADPDAYDMLCWIAEHVSEIDIQDAPGGEWQMYITRCGGNTLRALFGRDVAYVDALIELVGMAMMENRNDGKHGNI